MREDCKASRAQKDKRGRTPVWRLCVIRAQLQGIGTCLAIHRRLLSPGWKGPAALLHQTLMP